MRRTIWDGNQELAEIQQVAADSDSVAMESDGPAPLRQRTANGDPNTQYGLVIYSHGLQLDQPLAITRGNGQMYDSLGVFRPVAPATVSLFWNLRGEAPRGAYTSGALVCSVPPCLPLTLPRGWHAYERSRYVSHAWLGTLVDDKRDGAETYYRREREYDPQTGRFTQEDPIGLAGGMNLYGFAAGDPVNYADPFGLCPTCGDEAADYYAKIATDQSRSSVARGAANVGLALASLWTTDTWKETAMTLGSVAPLGRVFGTFTHFGYAEDAANFANGLRKESFATNRLTSIESGAEAVEKLALPARGTPNATYRVTPEWWKYVKGPTRVTPANGQPGGGWEYFFPKGTGPGTVSGPKPIP